MKTNKVSIMIALFWGLFLLTSCKEKDSFQENPTISPTISITKEPFQEQITPEITITQTPTITLTPTPSPTLTPTPLPEPDDSAFVKVIDYIPDIVVELRYATDNNFTGQQIYNFTDVWLRYGTVKKLMLVQKALKEKELSLKIWDGFRPVSAQFNLWEVYPDSTYVANPNNGFSSHSRGNTVDITLVTSDGTELIMPTVFDDFSIKADREYSDCNDIEKENALLLENLMIHYGFNAYSGEWWHFTDLDSYPVDEFFEPTL